MFVVFVAVILCESCSAYLLSVILVVVVRVQQSVWQSLLEVPTVFENHYVNVHGALSLAPSPYYSGLHIYDSGA